MNLNVHQLGERMNMLWNIYVMEYYLATKRDELMLYTLMNLKSIIQSARSQTQKTIHCMMSCDIPEKEKTIETEIRSVIAGGQG